MFSKNKGKWSHRTLSPITLGGLNNFNLELINNKMGFKDLYKDEASYAKAKAKAFKAEQKNRKIINNKEQFT